MSITAEEFDKLPSGKEESEEIDDESDLESEPVSY